MLFRLEKSYIDRVQTQLSALVWSWVATLLSLFSILPTWIWLSRAAWPVSSGKTIFLDFKLGIMIPDTVSYNGESVAAL